MLETGKKQVSQKKQILTWLNAGKSINPMQALNRFGCFRLAAIIFILKDEGNDITTTRVSAGGKNYASYSLTPKN